MQMLTSSRGPTAAIWTRERFQYFLHFQILLVEEHTLFDYARLRRDGVDEIVRPAVTVCGPVYGRKVMTGMLRASVYRLGERAVRHVLAQVTPQYTQM